MKLGSHNTMTYLKPKKWWMYPFRVFAKCQSKDIVGQYTTGARWFDIRISFDERGNPEFRHGMMVYKGDVFGVLDFFNYLNDPTMVVRILLEKDHDKFGEFCSYIEEAYPNVRFSGGQRKSDWKRVYKFKNEPSYSIEENYSSMPSNPKWYGILPWLYSKINNKKVKDTDKDYLLLDFVHLY